MLVLIAFLAVTIVLAFQRVKMATWTGTLGATLLLLTLFGPAAGKTLFILWVLYAAVALLFNVSAWRRQFITSPLFTFFKASLPPMSQTEKEALDAGDVWWEAELFCGAPNWKKLIKHEAQELSVEERAFMDNQVNKLCEMLDDWKIVQEWRDLPREVWDYMKKERFWGLVLEKKYGGHGFSALAHAQIVTRIASRCTTAAVTVMVPNSLGPGELLEKYGTEAQKDHYLPRLARGEEIPCFALTGPDAGSDAAAMGDRGVVCHGEFRGKQVLGMRVSWDKRYITLAPIATLLGLAFKLYDPDHLLGDKEDLGITLCLLPTNHPGVEVGTRHFPAGMPFMNGPTRGENVFVPMEWIIGGPEMLGQGWRMLMECLSIGRSISLPALATACGQLAFRSTGAYARVRKQFRMSIGNFEGVQEAMGAIGGYTYINNACQRMTAGAVDLGIKPAVASAITKYHMIEMGRKVMNHALDVHAGRGIQFGPRNYLGHGYMIYPVGVTVEGANILTRNLIIFGQGAVRCHPYIRAEMQAVNDIDQRRGKTEFDSLIRDHIGYSVSHFVRCVCYGLTAGKFIHAPVQGALAKYLQQINRMSTALATVSDVAMMILGGKLKRKERLSARLGDVLSYLYLASAVVKDFVERGQPAEELPLMKWSLSYCLGNIQLAFDSFFANFPVKILGFILRKCVFPWGPAYHMASDNLDRAVTKIMMHPSALRDRITEACYVGKKPHDPLRIVDIALEKMIAAEPAAKKFSHAQRGGALSKYGTLQEQLLAAQQQGLLAETEVKILLDFEKARTEALAVDEFAADYFVRMSKLCQNEPEIQIA